MIALTKTNTALGAAWTILQIAAAVALLAVVVGGLPLAITVIRRALTKSHQGLGWLLVPVLAFLVLAVYVLIVIAVGFGRIHLPGVAAVVQPGGIPAGNRVLMAGLMATFVLGAIASTLAVWKVVSRTDSEQETFRAIKGSLTVRIYHFAFWPAVVTTIAMFIMLVAAVTWGWLGFSALPGAFSGNYGLWGTSTQAWFIGIIVVMSLATLAAFLGVKRARAGQKP
jgi:hypothetical protein